MSKMLSPSNPVNTFSMSTYHDIIVSAQKNNYQFFTLSEFVAAGCPSELSFVIRHDLDRQPITLKPIVQVESSLNVKSTTFVRVAGAEYNMLGYSTFRVLQDAVKEGMEIGLHTNFVEFASINRIDPLNVLMSELQLLRTYFDVSGIAPHRDINYTYNSLPWLNSNWTQLQHKLCLNYHAYEQRILKNVHYVNEGFNPHLCWRSSDPFDVIKTRKSIYLLTHPHWWFVENPFESQ
jgi:hypothetical protein